LTRLTFDRIDCRGFTLKPTKSCRSRV
jgi:hypothetical protein